MDRRGIHLCCFHNNGTSHMMLLIRPCQHPKCIISGSGFPLCLESNLESFLLSNLIKLENIGVHSDRESNRATNQSCVVPDGPLASVKAAITFTPGADISGWGPSDEKAAITGAGFTPNSDYITLKLSVHGVCPNSDHPGCNISDRARGRGSPPRDTDSTSTPSSIARSKPARMSASKHSWSGATGGQQTL
nr:hypothetical protein Iba_chr06bCG9660 [Ipomoea batatas]